MAKENRNALRLGIAAAVFIFAFALLAAFGACPDAVFARDAGQSVTFVQISDVHLSLSTKNPSSGRMKKDSLRMLEDAIQQVNAMDGVDFVIFTGDLADGPNSKLHTLFAKTANKLNVPWYWAPGNHDISVGALGRKGFRDTLNKYNKYAQPSNTCYAFKLNGFVFFAMDGAIDTENTSKGYFSPECLGFLDSQLSANASSPAVMFQHFPLVYPIKSPSHEVKNQEAYLSILDRHTNATAVFSGHFHISKIKRRGSMLHVSSPSMIQYPNAFRVVRMENTSEGVRFDIRTIDTRLKDVQRASYNASPSHDLHAGQESDRNFSGTIK